MEDEKIKESEARRNLDNAITEYIKWASGGESFTTGWVVSVATSSLADDVANSDSYVTVASQGLPHHSQIGLLNVSIEERNTIGFLGIMSSYSPTQDDE